MHLYCLVSALFNAFATALLGFLVFPRNRHDPRIRTFTAVAAFIVAWSLGYFFWQLSTTEAGALLWCRLLTAAAILIPPAYFDFTNALLQEVRRRETFAGYAIAAALSALSLTPWMVASVAPRHGFAWWPIPGLLYPAYLAFFFWYILRSAMLLRHGLRQSSGLRRNQLRYIFTMTLLGYAGGSTNFFLWYDLPVPPLGNALVGVYMVGVAYAVVRLRLLEFNLLVARAVVYLALVAALAALTPLAYLALQPLAEGSLSTAGLLALVAVPLTGLVFVLAPTLQRRINARLDVRMGPAKASGREKLKSLSDSLWLAPDELRLLTFLGESIAIAYGVERIAVYRRRDANAATLEACLLSPEARARNWPREWTPTIAPPELLRKDRHGAVVIEEAMQARETELAARAFELKRTWDMRLLLPIRVQDELAGLVVLGEFPGSEVFSTADLDLLETVCLQAGLAITSRRMERDRGLTEKLISLGTMAAGLAHEIRNPLTSLQTFCSLVAEQGPNAEIAAEMVDVMRRDIDRISGIVDNVTHLTQNTRVPMEPLLLQPLLAQAAELSRQNRAAPAPLLFTGLGAERLDENLWVMANQNQLMQIFTNLFDNAHDALAGKPGAQITVHVARRAPDHAVVTIQDNGPGIHPSVLRHVFEPFVTTKAVGERPRNAGMGLGLSIVRLLVQGHGGIVSAENLSGGGAQFTVTFPLHRPPL